MSQPTDADKSALLKQIEQNAIVLRRVVKQDPSKLSQILAMFNKQPQRIQDAVLQILSC